MAISVATCERTFSKLKLIKNYLRSTMTNTRLTNLAILSIERDLTQSIDFDDVMLTTGYSGTRAYCQSKLAQIMFTIDLAREVAGTGITVNALHPATYMNTAMVRRAGVTPMSTVEQGAEAILNLATGSDGTRHSGCYFNGLRQARAAAQSYDADARHRLRAVSLALTNLEV